MDWISFAAWAVLVVSCLTALVGVILPGLPGIALMVIGAAVHKWLLPQYLSWWTIGVLFVGFVASFGIDLASSAAGARWGGASKYGLWGAAIGGVVGIFFGIPGLLLFPVLGAFVGELYAARTLNEAAKSGVGAGLGLAVGSLLRFLLALLLVIWIFVDCFF